jgi:hypothetical protein
MQNHQPESGPSSTSCKIRHQGSLNRTKQTGRVFQSYGHPTAARDQKTYFTHRQTKLIPQEYGHTFPQCGFSRTKPSCPMCSFPQQTILLREVYNHRNDSHFLDGAQILRVSHRPLVALPSGMLAPTMRSLYSLFRMFSAITSLPSVSKPSNHSFVCSTLRLLLQRAMLCWTHSWWTPLSTSCTPDLNMIVCSYAPPASPPAPGRQGGQGQCGGPGLPNGAVGDYG